VINHLYCIILLGSCGRDFIYSSFKLFDFFCQYNLLSFHSGGFPCSEICLVPYHTFQILKFKLMLMTLFQDSYLANGEDILIKQEKHLLDILSMFHFILISQTCLNDHLYKVTARQNNHTLFHPNYFLYCIKQVDTCLT